ncbi:MAG: hypothetical protein QM811_04445 [Pirellulales bacterium]
MANTGCTADAEPLAEHVHADVPAVRLRGRPHRELRGDDPPPLRGVFCMHDPAYKELQAKTFELCEFLVDVLKVGPLPGKFPYRVGLHQSCHGLRDLRLGSRQRVEHPDVQQSVGNRWKGSKGSASPN